MHLNVDNFFSEFIPQPEEFTLEGGQKVTIKKLTYGESQKISNDSIDGIDANGNPQIDFKQANLAKFKKISASLVEPKMTVNQLSALSSDADDLIDELFKLVDPKTWQSIEDAKNEDDSGN